MLNSGAFAANLRRVRASTARARDVLAATLSTASEGCLSVPVPSQGPAPGARFDPSVDPRVARRRQGRHGLRRLLLAENLRTRAAAAGFVLGFAGHPIPLLKASAERLQRHRWPRFGPTASPGFVEPEPVNRASQYRHPAWLSSLGESPPHPLKCLEPVIATETPDASESQRHVSHHRVLSLRSACSATNLYQVKKQPEGVQINVAPTG